MKKIAILMLAVFAFSCLSSQNTKETTNQDNKKISIKKIEVLIDNIDSSFWKKKMEDQSLYYNFYIYYNEPDLTANDIAFCNVSSVFDIKWTIDLNEYFNPESNYIGGIGRWYDSKISNNGSVLGIKDLKVSIKLKNNYILNYNLSLNGPDEYNSVYSNVYNEDYKGEKNGSYISAIKRAKIINKEKLENSLKIEFSVDDIRVNTGEIWLYNKDNQYIGEARNSFINVYSREISDYLNNGKVLNTSGEVNIINLKRENIEYDNEKFKFEDINYTHVVLKDTAYKYENNLLKNTVYRSISERIVF